MTTYPLGSTNMCRIADRRSGVKQNIALSDTAGSGGLPASSAAVERPMQSRLWAQNREFLAIFAEDRRQLG